MSRRGYRTDVWIMICFVLQTERRLERRGDNDNDEVAADEVAADDWGVCTAAKYSDRAT